MHVTFRCSKGLLVAKPAGSHAQSCLTGPCFGAIGVASANWRSSSQVCHVLRRAHAFRAELSRSPTLCFSVSLALSVSPSFITVMMLQFCMLVARLCHEDISISQIDNLLCRLPTPAETSTDAPMIIVVRCRQVLEASCNAIAARIRHRKAVPPRSFLPVPWPGQHLYWLISSTCRSGLDARTNGPCRTLHST